jgi:hypothetical protein
MSSKLLSCKGDPIGQVLTTGENINCITNVTLFIQARSFNSKLYIVLL